MSHRGPFSSECCSPSQRLDSEMGEGLGGGIDASCIYPYIMQPWIRNTQPSCSGISDSQKTCDMKNAFFFSFFLNYGPQLKSSLLPVFIYLLFIYFWLRWVFVAARGLSLVAASRGYSSVPCTGFSLGWLLLCGARALGTRASVVVARGLSSCGSRALERRLSSRGARA